MSEREWAVEEARRAQNQVIFRETNEQIRDVVEEFDRALEEPPFVCECSDPACRQLVNVPLEVYEEVRRSPRRFIHAPGHQADGTSGRVVATYERFAVVEKSGIAAKIAENNGRDRGVDDGRERFSG